jgi:hypothetical protein
MVRAGEGLRRLLALPRIGALATGLRIVGAALVLALRHITGVPGLVLVFALESSHDRFVPRTERVKQAR